MSKKTNSPANGSDRSSIHDKLTVLKHLAGGRDPDMVAAAMKMTRYQVIDLASSHGYPDQVKMAKAVTLIIDRLQRDEQHALTESSNTSAVSVAPTVRPSQPPAAATRPTSKKAKRSPVPSPVVAVVPSPADSDIKAPARAVGDTAELAVEPAVEPAAASLAPVPESAPLTKPDEIRVLLNTAKDLTSSKRIQRQTEKVFDEIARLRELVSAEQAKAEAVAAEKAERDAARAEVTRLEEQLRQAKARLRGTTTLKTTTKDGASTVSTEPPAKEIRAWAVQQPDLTCPATGRIPATVRAAYDAAHQTAAA